MAARGTLKTSPCGSDFDERPYPNNNVIVPFAKNRRSDDPVCHTSVVVGLQQWGAGLAWLDALARSFGRVRLIAVG